MNLEFKQVTVRSTDKTFAVQVKKQYLLRYILYIINLTAYFTSYGEWRRNRPREIFAVFF